VPLPNPDIATLKDVPKAWEEFAGLDMILLSEQNGFALMGTASLEDFKFWLTVTPDSESPEDWSKFILEMLVVPNSVSFAFRDRETQKWVGKSSFMDIRPQALGLEIGMTWIANEMRGTWVNPMMKWLMLKTAFERWGAIRVQLKTDGRNIHSQNAIKKLGATYEGTFRKHGIQKNGFIRDTAMFSITDTEWPSVEQNLLGRKKGS
jgi:RimJ/RimL family protein N-acetyltransferase